MASMKLIYLSNQTFIFTIGLLLLCNFYLSSSMMLQEVGMRSAARSSDPSEHSTDVDAATLPNGDLQGGRLTRRKP